MKPLKTAWTQLGCNCKLTNRIDLILFIGMTRCDVVFSYFRSCGTRFLMHRRRHYQTDCNEIYASIEK